MMTPQERVRVDPVFAVLVRSMHDLFERHCGTGAGITPSEVREASGLAWQMYAERHVEPLLVLDERRRPL